MTTDEEGHFRANGAAPETYVLTAESAGYHVSRAYTVDVPQNGCGIAHIGMFTNAGISGTVRRADGTPVVNVGLDLIDNARRGGASDRAAKPIPYALVVTVDAKSMPHIYNKIALRYRTQLQELKPVIQFPVWTSRR